MDYGQPVNNPNEMPFFTAGAGMAPENFNPDSDNSINVNIYSGEHDTRNLGNAAIFSPEAAPQAPQTPESFNPAEASNQDIPLEMPPGQELPDEQSQSAQSSADNIIDFNQISREKDRISHKTIKVVEKAESDFKRNAISPAKFYTFKTDATKAYMKTFEDQANWGKELAA